MNISRPVVSIVMSVYKEPRLWLETCIHSVIEQTYRDFEFIIVDDNPDDDDLRAYLSEVSTQDERIKVLYNDKNIGLTRSLNKACRSISGEYFARIDADDYWDKEKLATQLYFMNTHPSISVCGTLIYIINGDGQIISRGSDYPLDDSLIGKALLVRNPIVHSSVVIKVEAIRERLECVYDEEFSTSQDYALWTTLFTQGLEFANIPKRLVYYRTNPNQISQKKKVQQEHNAQVISTRYLNGLFSSLGIFHYDSLSCKELSMLLQKSSLREHYRVACYSCLLKQYVNCYRNRFRILFAIICNGDLFNYGHKELLLLLVYGERFYV